MMSAMPLVLCLILLAGCAATHGGEALSAPETVPFYVSRLDDPQAQALFHYGRYRLLADQEHHEEALEALRRAIELDPEQEELRFELAEYYIELEQLKQAVRTIEDILIRNPDSLKAHQRLGNAYAAGRHPQLAIPHYRKILELDPGNEQIHLHLIVVLVRSGDLGAAIETAKKLVERRPDLPSGRLALARLYRESRLETLAVEEYRTLIKTFPTFTQASLELGLLYEERQQWLNALQIFRAALENDPAEFSLHHHLARVYVAMQRYTDALGELQIIAQARPDDYDVRRKIGLIYLEQEKWDKAIAVFSEILVARPELDSVRYYLGTAQTRKEQWDAALETFSRVGEDSSFYDDALGHISYIYTQTGRTPRAIELLTARLQGPDPRPQQYYYLAVLHGGAGDHAAALQVLDQGLARFPGNSELLFEKALCHERRDEKEQALALMREVIAVDPDHPEALNFVAYALADENRDLDEALRLAQRAVELKPAGHIHDTLGWVYYRLGRYVEARQEIEAALRQLPDDEVILEHLGDVLVNLDGALAADSYRRILEINPQNDGVRGKLRKLEGLP